MEEQITLSQILTPNQPNSPQEIPPAVIYKHRNNTVAILVLFFVSLVGIGLLAFQNFQLRSQIKSMKNANSDSSAPVSEAAATELPAQKTQTGWLEYQDDAAGIKLKYPEDIILNQDQKGKDKLALNVRSKDLNNYKDEPMGLNLKSSLAEKKMLENGENPFDNHTNVYPEARRIIKLGDTQALMNISLQQIEVCDVRFIRSLVLYNKNHQILISLSAPQSYIAKMPQYFTEDKENCGDVPTWKSTEIFYNDLIRGKAPKLALDWYSLFDEIVETIELN